MKFKIEYVHEIQKWYKHDPIIEATGFKVVEGGKLVAFLCNDKIFQYIPIEKIAKIEVELSNEN